MKEFYIWQDEKVIMSKLFLGTEEEFKNTKYFCCKMWVKNGKLHREDGPAIVYSDEYLAWNIGKEYKTYGPRIFSREDCYYLEELKFYDFFNLFFPMMNYLKDKYPGE